MKKISLKAFQLKRKNLVKKLIQEKASIFLIIFKAQSQKKMIKKVYRVSMKSSNTQHKQNKSDRLTNKRI